MFFLLQFATIIVVVDQHNFYWSTILPILADICTDAYTDIISIGHIYIFTDTNITDADTDISIGAPLDH